MNLHPLNALLEKIRDRNLDRLELATAVLDAAVQDIYARHEPRFPSLQLSPVVLATDVRNEFFWYAGLTVFRRSGFRVEQGLNRSVILVDPACVEIKIRKHPRRTRQERSELVPVTPPKEPIDLGQPSLFGPEDEYEPITWDPTLLWDTDPQRQCLRQAWLGALEKETRNPRVLAGCRFR